jgi:Mg/Co/Ni transporter MgtE
MLGQMPTKHVIAMLNAAAPEQAAGTLLAMPADRVEVLLAEMARTEVARLLMGSRADRKAELVAVIGAHRIPAILALFNLRQLADLVTALPLSVAVELLRCVAPTAAADLLLEVPADLRPALREALATSQPEEFSSAVYRREAGELVVRVASRASWIDQATGHLLAEVMGRPFEIVVRYLPDGAFSGDDLRGAAARVDWSRVIGMVVLTNANPANACGPAIRELHASGRPADVVTWLNVGDDGLFKRAIVKLVT